MPAKLAVVSVIDAVTEQLRSRVLSGELAPGAPLAEVEVAEAYDVARPTAKAAIENLVRERLLDRSAHKTARVVRLTPEDVRDIYRTREIVESEVLRRLAAAGEAPAAALAANSEIAALADGSPSEIVDPDMRFHRSLIDAVGSERVSRLYDSLASEVVFCMSQVQGASLLPTAVIAGEHEELLRLIRAGDGDAAAALLAVHLGRARERLVGRLGGDAGPEASLPYTHVTVDGEETPA
ncbi:GntR family transcriptional regulator [Agromyces archimandritae]|uniref:GntR family transcriptional regulator n=1 Tax=Agromyces archimandritae TaxID=2781962 RepID=A0A975FJW4_9MICO|nr:GntR family transcriptional regulator [Agromyces archimandritae]QTX03399.1 GntR family transcriptional regulator [Agromyces archimandritae]